VPNSVSMKPLACVFVFSGMALVGMMLSKGADYLVEKQKVLLVKALNLRWVILAIFWILMSTLCLAQFFLHIAELNTEKRQKELVRWVLTKSVTNMDLEAANLDDNGIVVAAEFVIDKLKEMGKISQEDISVVLKEFEYLDVDQSGTLSTSDISLAQSS
ncbi:LOW QUALITY PROTEIN: two pore potassium channel a-like, partial [Coffea eugenioides]|uniref:LOW QUALITY PROTEIN: two pore potassium channel a-like n=1 Tax=Coffea eugenioides TaxID=49369 RepID=UPI000F60B296